MLLCKIGRWECRIDGTTWTSKNRRLERTLRELETHRKSLGAYDPDPELAAAQYAMGIYGGEITRKSKRPPFDLEAVY